ncbi:fibronectin type III domain-containing protein 7-like [Oreochromis aureus]|uniref:fibronectin type III domain-containing protein 7-like n=1 Tax=Oreochromis aureus TaxID=47969 RepID=UPI001953BE22|nr:fibronectin type III domain-containing protein 7-like [Oreochromis aureus]
MDSVPCGPEGVRTHVDCTTGELTVFWNISTTAENYTTVISRGTGQLLYCNSTEARCSTGRLECGSSYAVTVFSITGRCKSLPSREVTVDTLPCPPTNVTVTRTCAPHPVPVSWLASDGAKYYTAVAVSGEGHRSECTTNKTSCSLTGLHCGEVYTIGVSGADDKCTTQQSHTVSVNTEPCAPSKVSSQLICSARAAHVSWDPRPNALSYAVEAISDGQTLTCNSSSPNCTLSNLLCGQAYEILVTATDGTCVSNYSAPFRQDQVPCAPGNISTDLSCSTNDLTVSWISSSASLNYSVTAVPLAGNITSVICHTNGASCVLSGLQCGQTLNVSVEASSGICNGPHSPPQTVQTGPCDSVNVTRVLHCGSDVATVSWIASPGAVTHTVLAQDGTSHDYISCRTNTTSCQLKQLQCGKVYNLTVMSEDATCNSTGASQHVIMTAPCPPTFMNNTLICGTNSSSLSWTPVADATGYTVDATTSNGHKVSCSSATASCTLTDLQCSETYTATVTAHSNECDSAPGTSTSITTVIISKQYTCGTSTAVFRWTDPAGSLSFLAQVEGEGHQDGCHTTNTSCVFENLPCGLDLNVTVQAQGAQCNSSPSVNESLETVACAPQNVSTALLCLNHSALVTWVGSPIAIGYNVTATAQDGHTHHCYTNSTSCQVLDIHCGETYSITVTPYSQTCTGNPSAAYSFQAGRCAPGVITVSPACEGNSTVSWSPVMGADMYIATAVADDGHTHTCSSNYLDSCNFTDLHCGETYAVTVVSVDRGCWSEPSSAVQFRTALCPPTNLTGHVSCDANALTLTWDPVTGAIYVLQYEQIGGALPHSANVTSNSSHTLSNLLCGQSPLSAHKLNGPSGLWDKQWEFLLG